jgi:hypothetical protein
MPRSKLTEEERKKREEKKRIREQKKLKRIISQEIKWFLSHNDIKRYIQIGLGEIPSRYYARNVSNLADWMHFLDIFSMVLEK